MQIGPKYKICKRLGTPIFEKCQTQKFAQKMEAGQKARGKKRRGGNRSNFAEQLLEKQKARLTYGLSEEQFRRYVLEAVSHGGENPAQALYRRLEMRLDNVVYRLGLAKTRRMARQLVSHGHILVNGKKMTIPSYLVKVGDMLEVREHSKGSALWSNLEESYNPPLWLSFNTQKKDGSVQGTPTFDQATEVFDLTRVLEYYSR